MYLLRSGDSSGSKRRTRTDSTSTVGSDAPMLQVQVNIECNLKIIAFPYDHG